jgi:hypothetical protein
MNSFPLDRIAFALALVCGLSGAPADARAATNLPDLPLSALTAAWTDSNRVWQGIPEARRRDRMTAFFAPFHSVDLCRICRESAGAKETERVVEGFLRAKFESVPPTTDELVALLQDLTAGPACHKVVVQYLSRTKDSYSQTDGDRLGQALLGLADHAAYPVGIEAMLEVAAAHLSRADAMVARIERYAASQQPDEQLRAIDMMAESKDPRAADLMERTLEAYRRNGVMPAPRVLVAAGMRLGSRAYPFLEWSLATAPDEPTRMKVLEGLAHSKDPRALRHLLAAYGDSLTGIQDVASMAIDRAAKEHYFQLWFCTRLLEPTIIQVLPGSEPLLRAQALELVDRESRYGIPADPPGLTQALRQYAGLPGQDPANIKRVMEILARFELREAERPKH